ncbi:hypothetical protein GGD50_006353 [Rhizobium paranaense]|uniref:Uncharacterized protein n=1 Tax=Rhizobium paranaense TaxID=1650438 RepID=A0A7W9D4S8_9HYPH|nr:hypothetical protein [Rhizobium paranaense]
MESPITVRYILRPERHKLWSVWDTSSGKPAEFKRIVLTGLERRAAGSMLNALISEGSPRDLFNKAR